MKRFLVVLGIAFTLLAFFKPRVIAITPPTQQHSLGQILATSTTAEKLLLDLPSMVRSYSITFGINPVLSSCIISHESQWIPKKTGDDGNSRGLWQISKIWHSEVSDAISFNSVSSTIWSLKWIRSGHITQWSTYSEYCSDIPVLL